MSYSHVYLLRHGKPEASDCLLGKTDPPLTSSGFQQCEQTLTYYFPQQRWTTLLSSPKQRCLSFAKAYQQQLKLDLHVEPRLQEIDFGDWDGQKLTELWQQAEFIQYWQAPFQHTPPNGESMSQVQARLKQSLEALVQPMQEHAEEPHILVVTHAGVIRTWLHYLLAGDQQGNAHLSQVELGYASLLYFSFYQDEQQRLWPQLKGIYPCPVLDACR